MSESEERLTVGRAPMNPPRVPLWVVETVDGGETVAWAINRAVAEMLAKPRTATPAPAADDDAEALAAALENLLDKQGTVGKVGFLGAVEGARTAVAAYRARHPKKVTT